MDKGFSQTINSQERAHPVQPTAGVQIQDLEFLGKDPCHGALITKRHIAIMEPSSRSNYKNGHTDHGNLSNILKQQCGKHEVHKVESETLLEDRSNHLHFDKKVLVIQNDISAALEENLKLLHTLAGSQKEANEQNNHFKELVGINEELLFLVEDKEIELGAMKSEIERMGQRIEATLGENKGLMKELTEAKKEMQEINSVNDSFQSIFNIVKYKVQENEFELFQHEDEIERLTLNLSSAMEIQDQLLEEDEKIHVMLKEAIDKEQILDQKLHQSCKTIHELQGNLSSIESEFCKRRTDIAALRIQNSSIRQEIAVKEKNIHLMQNDAMGLQGLVSQLEDELMEKEGQISILRSLCVGDNEF